MTKEEMLKDFLSKAPMEIRDNPDLIDMSLPPMLDADETTLSSILAQSSDLQYDESRVCICATLPDCSYILMAEENRVKVSQVVDEMIDGTVTIDQFMNELSFENGAMHLSKEVFHIVYNLMESGQVCDYQETSDRTFSTFQDGFERRAYYDSRLTEIERLDQAALDCRLRELSYPTTAACRTIDSVDLERILSIEKQHAL